MDQLKTSLTTDFFDIHGAMSVVGLDDPEGDMITRIRELKRNLDFHFNGFTRQCVQTAGPSIRFDYLLSYGTTRGCHNIQTKGFGKPLNRLENGKGNPHTRLGLRYLYYCPEKKPVPESNREKVFMPKYRKQKPKQG